MVAMSRVAFACLILVATAGAAPDRAKEIDDYLARCERFGFSGSVLVVRDGKTLLQRGYGLADREKGVPATEHTVYEIASATTRVDHVRENLAAARGPMPDEAMRRRIAEHLRSA